MKTLKQVIHYPDTNSIEATWIDSEGVVIKCHSYADVQMDMFRADVAEFGGDITEYEELIALVEANIKPIPPTPQPILSCSPWQMRKKLNKEGLRQTVEDYVTLPDTPIEIKDEWLYATEFREDDPFVQQMAVMLQVEDLHAFIEDALTL